MSLTKIIPIIAAAGFLAGCEVQPNGSSTFPSIGGGNGGSSNVSVADAGLAGSLDAVSMRDGVLVYAYYTDVVKDGRVLAGADTHCGGAGQADITLNKGDRGGRAYNQMLITCR